jgi:hypothetical protein
MTLAMNAVFVTVYGSWETLLTSLTSKWMYLILKRLPFKHNCRLCHEGSYGIMCQVISVPVDVSEMVIQLPCWLSDDCTFNVKIKWNPIHKLVCLHGHVGKWYTRNLSAEYMHYISYFSYQWAVLNRLYNKRCLQYNVNFHSFNTYHARRWHIFTSKFAAVSIIQPTSFLFKH